MTRIKITSKMRPKIKHTGKSEPLLNSKKIAEALGAEEIIIAPKQTKDGRSYIEIISVAKSGRKRVYALDEKDAPKHTLLGTADGEDFFHCVYLAARHVKNFWKRICGYRFVTPISPKYKIAVYFYEKKVA